MRLHWAGVTSAVLFVALIPAAESWASCHVQQGFDTFNCQLSNGCPGTRECNENGQFTPCFCEFDPEPRFGACTVCGGPGTRPCTTSCTPEAGAPCTRPEVCNACDDDGDGVADDGLPFLNFFPDADGDGFGSASAAPENACTAPPGKVANNADCNDADPAIRPNAAELCNMIDDDCNAMIDDGAPKCSGMPLAPLSCSAPSSFDVPYDFSIPGNLARNPAVPSDYINNLDHRWKLYANPTVRQVALFFSMFSTEKDSDFLEIRPPTILGVKLSGTLAAGLRTINMAGEGQRLGADLRFTSDSSNTATGVSITRAEATCGAAPTSAVGAMAQSVRHEGILLGTGDTLFFSIAGGPEAIYVWMDGTGTPGFDFDLSVRNGALPTRAAADQRSTLPDGDEAILIPAGTAGQTIFVAVNSEAGAGTFRLRFSRVKPNEFHTLRVGTAFTATQNELNTLTRMIGQNMRRFFAMTEGQIVVQSATLENNRGRDLFNVCLCDYGGPPPNLRPCQVCIYDEKNRAHSNSGCGANLGPVFLFDTEFSDSWVLAHEWGHYVLGFCDEYNDHSSNAMPCPCPMTGTFCGHSDTQCGHSAMGAGYFSDLCTPLNHGKDTDPAGHVCSPGPTPNPDLTCSSACWSPPLGAKTAWTEISNRVTVTEMTTPDPYSYVDHAGLARLLTVTFLP